MLWTMLIIITILWLLGMTSGFGGLLFYPLLVIEAVLLINSLLAGRRMMS